MDSAELHQVLDDLHACIDSLQEKRMQYIDQYYKIYNPCKNICDVLKNAHTI